MTFFKNFPRGLALWLLVFALLVAASVAVAAYKKRLPGLGFLRKDKALASAAGPGIAAAGERSRVRTEPFVPPIGSAETNAAPATWPFVPRLVPGETNAGPTAGPFVPAMARGATNTDQKSAPFVPKIAAAIPGPDGRTAEPARALAFVPPIGTGAATTFLQAGPVVPAITPVPAASATPSRAQVVPALPPSDPYQKRIAAAVKIFMSGDRSGARDLLSGVDLVKANSAPAWELAGLLKEFEGDNKAAEDYYTRGIGLTPTGGLFYRRAVLRRTAGNFPQALEDMDRAEKMMPENPVFSNDRILLLIQMGRKAQAGSEMKALSDRGGEADGWIFGFCGMALEKSDYGQARNLLGIGKRTVAPEVFEQMLKNPVISRHQSRPEIMPFFFSNIRP
jgi:hypothetical protein